MRSFAFMTDEELQGLLRERAVNTCTIQLGTDFACGIGLDDAATSAVGDARVAAVYSRGERTVDVYRGGKLDEQLIATRDQVRALILAGAKPAPLDVEKAELDDVADELAQS